LTSGLRLAPIVEAWLLAIVGASHPAALSHVSALPSDPREPY